MLASPSVPRLAELLRPASDTKLEGMALESQAVTRRHFGKVMRLFAPLYLSNECINSCLYCGFSRENAILRVTLEIGELLKEARKVSGISSLSRANTRNSSRTVTSSRA
jgi:2-iminoacetate synthase